MSKYIIYNIKYSKNDKTYYLWKTLYKDNVPVGFIHIFAGSRYSCIKYANQNKLKLNEKLVGSLENTKL